MACARERPALRDGGEDDAAERGAGDDGEADGEQAAPAALAARQRSRRGSR